MRHNVMHELDPNQAGQLARRQFPSALMSDTKWRKLIGALEASDAGLVQMVVKFIDASEPRIMAFPPSLDCPYPYMDTIEFGPAELRAIEWLEFPKIARVSRADNLPPRAVEQDLDLAIEVVSALGKYPLESGNESLKISGYRR